MARLRTAVLGLALLAGSASIAAAQTATPGTPPAAGRQDSVRRGSHAGMKHGKKGMRGGHGMRALFRGVQLTPEQRTQVQQIRTKYQPQRQALVKAMQPAMTDARTARQRGDTTAAKAAFARTADTRAKLQALREQQLRDVRAILTPAQQQTFDRNVAQVKDRQEKRQQNHGQHRGRRA